MTAPEEPSLGSVVRQERRHAVGDEPTMATPEQRLLRSLATLRELVDALVVRSPSEAADLVRLDRLVRRYPAAARMSLRLRQRIPTGSGGAAGLVTDGGCRGDPCLAVGRRRRLRGDRHLDQLRYIGVALHRFDRMTADELHAFIRG